MCLECMCIDVLKVLGMVMVVCIVIGWGWVIMVWKKVLEVLWVVMWRREVDIVNGLKRERGFLCRI